MPSPQMREVISELRQRQRARAGQAPPPLDQVRAAFAPQAGAPLARRCARGRGEGRGRACLLALPPAAAPGRVLLFVHGGGYSPGSLRSHGELAARLGRAAGMPVLFPEYRLAPGHPFPAAAEDVQAVWRWLRDTQGQAAESTALCGDSAGGALIMGLLTTLRDAGEDRPAAAALMSPTST